MTHRDIRAGAGKAASAICIPQPLGRQASQLIASSISVSRETKKTLAGVSSHATDTVFAGGDQGLVLYALAYGDQCAMPQVMHANRASRNCESR